MKTITCKAPIAFEQLAEIMQEEEQVKVQIDYTESEYKGRNLLYYISNVDIDIDISFESQEDALRLLRYYFNLDRISDIPYLNSLAGYVLMRYAKQEEAQIFFTGHNFNEEMVDEWIEENKEVVQKWHVYFQSLPVFMVESMTNAKKVFPVDQVYKEIDNINYVSLNTINLVSMPGFVDSILSVNDTTELLIFKEQFQEAIYNGKNLFYYLIKAESEVFAACIGLFNNKTTIEEMKIVEESATEIEALLKSA